MTTQQPTAQTKKCKDLQGYFCWLTVGATPDLLDPNLADKLIAHAKRCEQYALWIKNNLHFNTVKEFQKFVYFHQNRKHKQ